ncbi:MAG: MFS transporter [Bryobacteraceae bacterium]|nr:MFS transporter [Bryobacteraceae bacterium]MDW8378684.1 MFS transporter [Bryobacterales bacterium]
MQTASRKDPNTRFASFSLWVPALAMTLVSLISYIDRNTLALLAPTILQETQLTNEEYGWIISAFSVLYMLGNPLWGGLLDRIGVRAGMFLAVSFWTLASVSHAFASSFWSFALARAALGFGEGATFPGGLRTVMQTLPPRWRSRGIAVAYSGGSLGAILTPLIVTPVAAAWGWRGAFWFTGLIGAAWLLFWRAVAQRPELRHHQEITASAFTRPSFRDPRLWSYMAAYALGGLPLAFVLYHAAIYLGQALGQTQWNMGKLLWIPPLGWELGYFFWGWVVDRTHARSAEGSQVFRKLFFAMMLLSLPLALASRTASVGPLMAHLFFAMFIAAGFVIVSVAYATHVFSADRSGFLAGLGAGSWSLVVAFAMPRFGRLFDQRRYDAAFLLAALLPVVGWALWRLLEAQHNPAPSKSERSL